MVPKILHWVSKVSKSRPQSLSRLSPQTVGFSRPLAGCQRSYNPYDRYYRQTFRISAGAVASWLRGSKVNSSFNSPSVVQSGGREDRTLWRRSCSLATEPLPGFVLSAYADDVIVSVKTQDDWGGPRSEETWLNSSSAELLESYCWVLDVLNTVFHQSYLNMEPTLDWMTASELIFSGKQMRNWRPDLISRVP